VTNTLRETKDKWELTLSHF